MRDLISNLNNLCSYLDNWYEINSGACCYVAYLIAKHLDKLNVGYKLIVYADEDRDLNEIENEVMFMEPNKTRKTSIIGNYTCFHYDLLVSNREINFISSTHTRRYVISGINSENIKWIYDHGDWNKSYDRIHNNYIERNIDNLFKDYSHEKRQCKKVLC